MEEMEKLYETCGSGLLELCSNVESIAQAMGFYGAYAHNTFERIEEEWPEEDAKDYKKYWNEKAEEAREELLKLTLDGLKNIIDKIFERAAVDGEYDLAYPYGNETESGGEDGERYVWYSTSGGLEFRITENGGFGYIFEVFPPKGRFRAGSTLYEVLHHIGYDYINTHGCNIGKSKIIAICAVCRCEIIELNGNKNCPFCGREFTAGGQNR